ncbi:DUF6779 domain-containing protein [Blastococcus aggregatus]|nr:DUF6779 domain-containing protein [Blastococcus aggregatus]
MPRSHDDAVAGGVPRRVLVVAGGFLLAAAATLAVFLTDNPQYLRIAVVAVAWAFVLATFAAGRRGGDRAAAAAREAQLRRTYEHELDLEVAARREYELELENELRRQTEQTMREELDALRGELAALAELRDQVAGVAALRADLSGLSGLREEVARVAAMRDDIVALGSLRHELGQLHELRDDMGRLRAELTEQLSSEMLIERIVMRTQASRVPGEPTRTLEASWGDETPRELTGGWPAVRLDEARETRQFEQVRVERTDVRPSPAPHTAASWTPPAPHTSVFAGPQPSRLGPPPTAAPGVPDPAPADPAPRAPATTTFPLLPPPTPVAPPPSPLDWLVARELLDVPEVPAAAELPAAPEVPAVRPAPPRPSPRRRRSDDAELPPVPVAEARTAEQPGPGRARPRIEDRGGYRVAMPDPAPTPALPPVQPAGPTTSPGSANRLAEILAENGVSPAAGGRRRRRYREDGDGSDDVLSRVLGRD